MKTEDQIKQILDEVLSVAIERGEEAAAVDDELSRGMATAYYDLLDHAINEADLVGYDLSDLGLDGKRIDQLILPKPKKAS
ncbi:MAG: hypothetical protein AB2552_05785 [Candidatus Thiodiazotropha endolucinida]